MLKAQPCILAAPNDEFPSFQDPNVRWSVREIGSEPGVHANILTN